VEDKEKENFPFLLVLIYVILFLLILYIFYLIRKEKRLYRRRLKKRR